METMAEFKCHGAYGENKQKHSLLRQNFGIGVN